MSCNVSRQQLWSWIDSRAPELEIHLAECPVCRSLAEEYGAGIRRIALGSTPLTIPLPEQIGAYTIKRLLGEGGQALVYEAEQQNPRRLVALKVLKGGRCVTEHQVRHLEREAQALALLDHPGIATIYEAGRTPEGLPYFAMQLVSGLPLDEYIRTNALPLPDRLALFAAICDAVDYAHQRGVIHRDLKPSNILVDAQGNPKILDFGLSRIVNDDATLTIQTHLGHIEGTVRYMSPEQARGQTESSNPRSDVYSLGVILYELLTNRPPLDPGPQRAAPLCTVHEAPPRRPRSVDRTIGREVEAIALMALEREPSRRYASAGPLAKDVRCYLGGAPVVAKPPNWLHSLQQGLPRRRRWVVTAAAVAVLALVLLAAQGWWQHRLRLRQRQDELVQARREVLKIQHLIESGGAEGPGRASAALERYPQLPEALLVGARGAWSTSGSRLAAIGVLRNGLQQNPSRSDCAALLAEMYRQSGDAGRAAELEQGLARATPQTAEAWYVRSFATLSLPEAERCAVQAVACEPTGPWASLMWERLARLCLLTENYDGALNAGEHLLNLGDDPLEWTRFRAGILARQGHPDGALREYDQLVQTGHGNHKVYFERAHVYRRLRMYAEAVADYTRAKDAGFTVWPQYQRATVQWISGHPEEAERDLRDVRPLLARPSYADARLAILLQDCERQAEAQEVLQRALREIPADDPWLRAILSCLAGTRSSRELVEEAAGRGKRKQLCEAYYYAGEADRLAGQMAAARECFEQCVRTGVCYDLDSFPQPMNEYELAQWRLAQFPETRAALQPDGG